MENEIIDYLNESDADDKLLKNVSLNLIHSGELWPISDKPTNSNVLCDTVDGDPNSCYIYNYTCVGEPEYCNLTEEEYFQMIYDYIFPTPGEWVLIGFHTIVFLVGLVSNYCCNFNFCVKRAFSNEFPVLS